MVMMDLYETRTITTSSGNSLTLKYYLLKTVSQSMPVYGIRIYSISKLHFKTDIHSEEVSKISYSFSKVLSLLNQCVDNQVTPTDLLTSLDTLMNESI